MSERLLKEQWSRLRSWLDEAAVLEHADERTRLAGWTVGDLVAHLGLGLGLLRDIAPAPADATRSRWRSTSPPTRRPPGEISGLTHNLAERLRPDVLAGVDALVEEAFVALDGCDTDVVLGRRGPLRRTDYVVTRLIELVVHADDLAEAVGEPDPPIVAEAESGVADALRAAYRERTGRAPADHPDRHWIRLATGRLPDEDDALPLL